MLLLTLTRHITANGAVVGVLKGLSKPLYTLENEWRDNKPMVSAIPTETYTCVPHGWEAGTKVSKPKTWALKNVPGRSDVLIHIGNYTKDTKGCILAGMGLQITQLQSMVSDSTAAIDLMRKEIGPNGFMLTVQ